MREQNSRIDACASRGLSNRTAFPAASSGARLNVRCDSVTGIVYGTLVAIGCENRSVNICASCELLECPAEGTTVESTAVQPISLDGPAQRVASRQLCDICGR